MDIIYLLVPISVVLVGVIVWAFLWAVRRGQFDDLERHGHDIFHEDDAPLAPPRAPTGRAKDNDDVQPR